MTPPIFLYHHVVNKNVPNDLVPFVVEQESFRWQMDLLEEAGYSAVTLYDLFTSDDWHKKVILTFDDCPRNLLDFAIPYLEQKQWKAVFFPPVGFIGGFNEWNVRKGKTKVELMTADEIRNLSDAGHEVGGHSVNHVRLNECGLMTVKYELRESKKQLEEITGKHVTSFAYPYGHYPRNYREVMQEAGYTYAVSMYSKFLSPLNDPYCIRRTVVDTDETVKSFKWKLTALYNYLRIVPDWFVLKKEGL
jgi:peptidoglycan/xylan/chitin deacetylase (PgdA/CDA1 family)